MIIYEIHTGTFTHEGTFEAIIPFLDYLKNDLGVTAIELMPVAQFPGERNWGYDGTYLYAPQNSYGGPNGLKSLINACHQKGLAVILDVVYNHLGPRGTISVITDLISLIAIKPPGVRPSTLMARRVTRSVGLSSIMPFTG